MDINFGNGMDLTTAHGFLNAVYYTCLLKPGSAMMAAPVCGSFVFLQLVIQSRSRITSRVFASCISFKA